MIYRIKAQQEKTPREDQKELDMLDDSARGESFDRYDRRDSNSDDEEKDIVDIKYMNYTFFKMFLQRIQQRLGSQEEIYLNNFKEIFENDKLESSAELKKEYLSKIFLRKTGYVIEENIRVE